MEEIENREQMILAGLYLSKFDNAGLEKLGFSSFQEAFNVIGYALNGKPASIKNYRDEFDPYFNNKRKGWHNRELREYCKKVLDLGKDLNFDDFSKIISGLLVNDYELKTEINNILNIKNDEKFINRISTGVAAENFFIQNYKKKFENYSMQDTRQLGCGFDFKLSINGDFLFVEVKGLQQNKGSFLMTEKEFDVAKTVKERYCLYVVKNFKETPSEILFFNPTEKFKLKQQEQKIIQISYIGNI